MTYRARLTARRNARILASLPPVPLANDDPQRSPDWCHSHNCHRSECQH